MRRTIFLIMLCSVIFSSCDLFNELVKDDAGSLTISIEASGGRGINWLPDSDISKYRIILVNGSTTLYRIWQKDEMSAGQLVIDGLRVGAWTVDIEGYNADDDHIADVSGGAFDVSISRGTVSSVSKTMIPCTGNGTLEIDITTESAAVGLLKDPYVKVSLKRESDPSTIYHTSTHYYSGNPVVPPTPQITGLPNGYYEVTVELYKDLDSNPDECVARSVFFSRILKGVTTVGEILIDSTLTDEGDSSTYLSFDDELYMVHSFLYDETRDTNADGLDIHSFSAPASVNTVDCLIVAGGAGSAGDHSGGGGAGGLIYLEAESVGSSTYTLTVGDGGAGFANVRYGPPGNNGKNSMAFGYTAIGGGGSMSYSSQVIAASGGSGGGGGGSSSTSYRYGTSGLQSTSTPGVGYGNPGGNGLPGSHYTGGGGGGAGQAGENAVTNKAGDGGDGMFFGDVFGIHLGEDGWFAGGGGGAGQENHYTQAVLGYGGNGGGGDSSGQTVLHDDNSWVFASDGQDGTGGGGGGVSRYAKRVVPVTPYTCSGGSGIIIVRYAVPNSAFTIEPIE